MRKRYTTCLSAVFFCSAGWVYSGPALGADGAEGVAVEAEPVAAAPQAVAPATQPAADAAAAPAPAETPAPSLFEAADKKDPHKLPEGQSVNVGSFGQIDLHVKDLELTQVLQLLSIQSQRNIVATKNVAGSISADLYGVDFYEALDAILHTNGFGYREKGNFVYVYTAAEIKAMEEADRKTIGRVYRLNYITAGDASKFVSPLLSPAGSIAVSADSETGFAPTVGDGGANTYANGDVLIIRDYPENVDEIVAVVEDLDVRPKQVLVEASVLQARLSEENAWGVDLTILADFAIDEFTSPLGVIDDLLDNTGPGPSGGAGTSTPGNVGSGDSTLKVGIISKNVAAFIKALDSVTDTTVLANPKLLVLNRQRADLLVGEKLGYISTTTTDTSATQTVEFLEVGTQLTLRPFVSEDGFIRLELRPSISDGETRAVGNVIIPNETTQELTTNVMVRNGQTVVLGGLFKEDTTIARRQVPYLGDVPIVGAAFKGQDDTVTRSEVIFLVTPTIVKDEAMYAAGDKIKDQLEMARIGAREGLLPWSRSKLTAAHMRDALQHYKEGDREKALLSANMALDLDPTTTEAMRLKEELTGQRTYWPDNGVMQDSIDAYIKSQVDEVAPEGGASEAPATQPAAETAEAPAAPEAQPAEPTAWVEPTPVPAGPEFDAVAGPGAVEMIPTAAVETDEVK
jgi:type IV pilus assembly protein PilQ